MTRPAWLDEPRIQEAIERAVASAPRELTADQLDLLRRTGFFRRRSAASSSTSDAGAEVEPSEDS